MFENSGSLESVESVKPSTDIYYYFIIFILICIFLYTMYSLFYVNAYHFYQNNKVEGFVANIKEEDRIRRVDMAENVLNKIKKENSEMDAYLQKKSHKDTYEEIIYEMNDLVNKNMLGLVSNMDKLSGYKSYALMQQVNGLQTFKGALSGILEILNVDE